MCSAVVYQSHSDEYVNVILLASVKMISNTSIVSESFIDWQCHVNGALNPCKWQLYELYTILKSVGYSTEINVDLN